jgi:glycoside/pentoside/hexuronide:cation symporter, GPH family
MSERISKREKLAYGGGDLASNFIFTTVNTFLLVFYTDVVGIAPAVAGAILLGARFWDAVNDPIMGMMVDRTRTRWGKFRPYLLFGAIPFGLVAVLTFSSPAFLGDTGRIVYAVITYVLLGMVYTAVNTPYGALTSAMTQDPTERTNISAVRMFMAILGALIVSTLIPVLVPIIGGGDPTRGYPLTMAIFSVLGVALLFWTFSAVKERVKDVSATGKVSFRDFFSVIAKNDQLLLLSVVFLVLFTNNTIVGSVGVFFFTYVLGDVTLFSLYSLANFVPLLVGIPLMAVVAARIGKKKTMIIGLLISLAGPIAILLFTQNFVALLAFRVIASIGASAGVAIVWGLVPDTVEYGQWKTGVRAEGATYSIVGFFFKLGVALGGIIPGLVLQAAGYVANVPQTERSLTAIIGLYSWVPIIITLIGLGCLLFYRLNEEYYEKILRELGQRAKQA